MTEGCHGATIPCGTEGLTPCADCCGSEGRETVATGVTDASAGFAAPSDSQDSMSAFAEEEGDTPMPSGDASERIDSPSADEDEGHHGVLGIVERLRAIADATDPKSGSQPMPNPSLQRIRDFRATWEKINDVCEEMARQSVARRHPRAPRTKEDQFLESCLLWLRVNGGADMRFASRLAESATVSISWATGTERLASRPMGAELELMDVSHEGHYPTRSAKIVSYSLVEVPADMRRRGVAGIVCKSEIACSGGVLGGTQYEGIDNYLWQYRNVSPSLTFVPLTEDEWQRANDTCDAYAKGIETGSKPTSRPLDGIGEAKGDETEVVDGRISETAECANIRSLLDRTEHDGRHSVTIDSFVLMPRKWEEVRKSLIGRRRR